MEPLSHSKASSVLGETLFSKTRAAALYDMNIASNEAGDHVFITAPGAFHKFSNPLTEDAFDHAKAPVAALSYGMSQSAHVIPSPGDQNPSQADPAFLRLRPPL